MLAFVKTLLQQEGLLRRLTGCVGYVCRPVRYERCDQEDVFYYLVDANTRYVLRQTAV